MKPHGKQMNWLKTLPLFCALALGGLNAGANDGNSDGAGGDGVMVEGKLVLRDLVNDPEMDLLPDNAAFLREKPEFTTLIAELSEARPLLAAEVIQQLMNARIWISEKPLPILPEAVTSAIGAKPDVQIAVRFNNDIIISAPALRQAESYRPAQGAYVLFHEALHGILGGAGPVHHQSVRSLVRYVDKNRGSLTSDGLARQLKGLRVYMPNLDDADAAGLLKTVINGTPEDPVACASFALTGADVYNSKIYFLRDYHDSLGKWSGLSQCSPTAHFEFFEREEPALAQFLSTKTFSSSPYILEIRDVPSWYSLPSARKEFREECEKYGSEKMRAEIEASTQQITQNMGLAAEASSRIKRIMNSTETGSKELFLRLFSQTNLADAKDRSYQWGTVQYAADAPTRYLDRAQALKNATEIYEKNSKLCAE